MAEEQKPVEVPKETVPATTEQPAAETKPAETTETPAAADATTETPAAATETPAEAAAEAAAPVEEAKKEVVPVEEGTLEHKGVNFPKNFIYTKEFFWFGSDAVEAKNLAAYLKTEKNVETAHHNAAWASHTGKGLLFFGDKTAPQGVINLADAAEPAADGANKFHFTAKGHKHVFKAANAEERDNWISQLKLKTAEAKELSTTVPETEAYKAALETLKPAKKEEKAAEAPAAEAAAATETPATENTAEAAATEEAAKETPKEEEAKKDEPKRRSASRKRASIFGNLLGKKEEKKEEKEEAAPAAEAAKEETPAVPAIETPAAETPVAEAPAAVDAPVAASETAEEKPAEAAKEEKKEKPVPTKRNSIFGVFGKKEKKAAVAADAEAAPAPLKEGEVTPAAETAPVIPPVEATTPLAVDVANPTTVPVEVKETAPATNGESRPELKEKRKSSLPFGFGKRDKSPAAKSPVASDAEEADKQEKTSAFSKLRATIKGRGKTADKPADKLEKTEEKAEETPATETPAAETSKAAEEPENKPENVASSAPAPVTAAA